MSRFRSFSVKKLVPGVLCALFTLGSMLTLTGCHGAKETSDFDIPEEFDETQQIEITFWAKNDTNKAQTNIYEKAAADFHELYPNVTVNIRLYTDYTRIYNDVITNIATNTTPNVCITYPDNIATYLTGDNQVVKLDDLMVDAKYGLGGSEVRFDSPSVDEIIPQYLNECVINGNTYAMPYMRSTEACYINKTYLEALGYEIPDVLTWDFVWEVSEAAMKKDADDNFVINGQKVMIPFIYKSTDNMMIQMLKQKGADYTTDDGAVLLFNKDTEEILTVVAEHVSTGAFSTFKISSYPGNYLNAGQCIFAIDSTAGSTWMGSDAPLLDIAEDALVPFETVVRPIPQYDTENPYMISQGPSVCIFNKEDSQEVLASWLFVQYLLSNDVQIPYAETEGYVPVTLKAQNDETYLDYLSRGGEDNNKYYYVKIDATKLLIENVDKTFVTPVFNGSASVREAAGSLIESTAKSVRRHETIDGAYFTKLYDSTNSLYRLDQKANDASGNGKRDLGPLPAGAKALLISLVGVWVCILTYFVLGKIKSKKNADK